MRMAHCACARNAVLLVLLALAAGASAQRTCTKGKMFLNLVGPSESTDPIAKCLTGLQIDLLANCAVTITSNNSAGSYVDGLWAADPSKIYDQLVECPRGTGPAIVPTAGGNKVEAIKTAIIKAFRGYVYGFDGSLNYKKDLNVYDLDWFQGRAVVKRDLLPSLTYAITSSNFVANDFTDDVSAPLSAITTCSQLGAYSGQCLPNALAAAPCPDNSYPVLVKLNPNAYNDQQTQFQVCGLCPAGTFGGGTGCTTCPAGTYSNIGGPCNDCPSGTYSQAGSSDCQPCPAGTFTDQGGQRNCEQCPEDSYSWIPGSAYCLRCIEGVPQICDSNGCPSNDDSSPGTHILAVNTLPTCALDSTTGAYELKAYSKCSSWKSGSSPKLQLALEVAGDCSIQISPITDPACADPTSTTGYPYGAIQMQAYYQSPDQIRTLMASDSNKSLMLAIDALGSGSTVTLKYFAATTDAAESESTVYIKKSAGAGVVKTCSVNATVTGGLLVNVADADSSCPPGTFYHGTQYCPICPVGYTCPGGGAGAGLRIPCDADEFNPLLGLGASCPTCSGAFTSYEGAASCAVQRVDTECKLANTGGTGMQYDKASQQCEPCPPGTSRDDDNNVCVDCPMGTFSAEGAADCSPCPAGQYNPSPGLPDQTGITGLNCVACAEGSIPLVSGDAGVAAIVAPGATYCDACPAGTYQPADPTQSCQLCEGATWRSGDATPENNVCKNVPSGYYLTDATHTTISLCPRGTVSFWYTDAGSNVVRAPSGEADDELRCVACSQLDVEVSASPLKFAHTYAPRRGMTKCIPCPGGTVPKDNGDGETTACTACPNGSYRDAYTISATCLGCGAGKEVGSSSKMDCVNCQPGTYMDADRATLTTTDANSCEECPQNFYRPTYGATSCLACPRGTETADEGNVECTDCAVGYYNNKEGQSCQPAPAGNYVNTTGAYVSLPCPQGSWNDEEGLDNCDPCAPGKYSNTMGSKECKTCPGGTYSAGQAISCLSCNAGYSSPAGAAACSPCKPGTYAPDAKSATCKQCPKGFQCPTNAMRKEAPCPRGTFSNREGLRTCSPCPANTYSLGGGSPTAPTAVMACIRCPTGTNTRGLVGQSKCQTIRPQVKRLFF